MPISLRIGPLTTTMAAIDEVLLIRAEKPLAASARMTGRYAGPRARHDGVHGHLLDCELPRLAVVGRAQLPTISSRSRDVPASIASTRSSVGRTIGR